VVKSPPKRLGLSDLKRSALEEGGTSRSNGIDMLDDKGATPQGDEIYQQPLSEQPSPFTPHPWPLRYQWAVERCECNCAEWRCDRVPLTLDHHATLREYSALMEALEKLRWKYGREMRAMKSKGPAYRRRGGKYSAVDDLLQKVRKGKMLDLMDFWVVFVEVGETYPPLRGKLPPLLPPFEEVSDQLKPIEGHYLAAVDAVATNAGTRGRRHR
jgi:hypothetical protein